MADPRFFQSTGPYRLGELASRVDATLADESTSSLEIHDVAPLDLASKGQISFLDNPKYVKSFEKSKAEACVIDPKYQDRAPKGMGLLLSPNPYHAYALIAQIFYPETRPSDTYNIHETVTTHISATIGRHCNIGAHTSIGANAKIGNHCRIGAGVAIGDGVEIGDHTIIHANVSISHAVIGNRVTLHHGACIGQDGFGFATHEGQHITVPQLGRVIIEDDVNIGANTCIDRGAGPDTMIGAGTRIDNLVQIGHNVRLGKGCIVVAQAGVAGSTRIGDYVVIGGQVAITGHVTIGNGVQIAAKSGVTKSIADGKIVGGSPAMPIREWRKQIAAVRKLVKTDTN